MEEVRLLWTERSFGINIPSTMAVMQKNMFCWLTVIFVAIMGLFHVALEQRRSTTRGRSLESSGLEVSQSKFEHGSSTNGSSHPESRGKKPSVNTSTSDYYEPLRRLYPELYEKIPETFSKQFKNPCWLDQITKELRCLPYFYQIGMPKCGTTDLWAKLLQHPQVQYVPKEPHWWSRRRNGWTDTPVHAAQVQKVRHMTRMKDDSSIEWYLNWFEAFATPKVKHNRQLVFGDGSVSTSFTSLAHWREDFPGAKEPPYTLADLIHSVQASAKIVAIVREPISRYFSAHLYNKKGGGRRNADSFKRSTEQGVECMKSCVQKHSDRFCVYVQACDQIFRGMYSIFLSDWLKAFGKEQVHVVRLDDWITEPVEEYKRLIAFLEIGTLSDSAIHNIVKSKAKNSQRKKKASAGEVSDSTRRLLEEFYRPYNHRLADLLNNTDYLWDYG